MDDVRHETISRVQQGIFFEINQQTFAIGGSRTHVIRPAC
jgi:hypothetical protein